MPNNYEEAYQLFMKYIKNQITSIKGKLKNADQSNTLRGIYKVISDRDYSKIIEFYSILSKINDNIKDNLDVIDFLVKNDITNISQMEDSINAILNDKDLLRLISNQESKEMMEGQLEKLTSIIDGTCDFDTLKKALLKSDLTDEDIIAILTYEAEKVAYSEKKELPSLEEEKVSDELLSRHKEIFDKISSLIETYYFLIDGKSPRLLDNYRKTIEATRMVGVNELFEDKEVLATMHILYLIGLKGEAKELLESEPLDPVLLEINEEELTEAYGLAIEVIKEYDKEQRDSLPLDSTVYFLLEDGKVLFDLEKLSETEKKSVSALLKDLEMGSFDYERSKGTHTLVQQTIRRDLNVFVNKRRNMSVSYIRVNSDSLDESKVLVLDIADVRDIFDRAASILKTKGKIIERSISCINEGNKEFLEEEQAFSSSVSSLLPREDVKVK